MGKWTPSLGGIRVFSRRLVVCLAEPWPGCPLDHSCKPTFYLLVPLYWQHAGGFEKFGVVHSFIVWRPSSTRSLSRTSSAHVAVSRPTNPASLHKLAQLPLQVRQSPDVHQYPPVRACSVNDPLVAVMSFISCVMLFRRLENKRCNTI